MKKRDQRIGNNNSIKPPNTDENMYIGFKQYIYIYIYIYITI